MQVTGLRFLPLVAGILPLLAVTTAHWIGVESGRLPACIPYIDGCLSISATGRHPPGSYLFKAVHLPLAALLAVLWQMNAAWLKVLAPGQYPRRNIVLVASGSTGAFALLVYTIFLGSSEPIYEFMRRFGIYFYFLGTVIAQLLTSLTLLRQWSGNPDQALRNLSKWMTALTVAPFLLGALNLVLKSILDNADAAENRIEWIAALTMQAWLVLLYICWRKTGFQIGVSARP